MELKTHKTTRESTGTSKDADDREIAIELRVNGDDFGGLQILRPPIWHSVLYSFKKHGVAGMVLVVLGWCVYLVSESATWYSATALGAIAIVVAVFGFLCLPRVVRKEDDDATNCEEGPEDAAQSGDD